MSIPLYTFNYFDPDTSVALGTVIGKNAQGISLLRGAIAGVKAIFGGKASDIEKKVQDATDGAKTDFYQQLRKEFPNATSVVGLNIQVSEMEGFIIVLMSGTAIGSKRSGGSKTYKKNGKRSKTNKNKKRKYKY